MNTLIKNLQKLSKSMEQKREVGKVNIFGAALFFVAAFFAVSLLLSFFGMAGGNVLSGLGNFLFNAYGYSSILIPIFFVTAALQMIGAKWNIKRGVILIGSILPFFTLVAIEHICKIFAAKNAGAVLGIKISSTILFGLIIFAGEYILLVILGDVFQERYSKGGFDFDNFDESDYDRAGKSDADETTEDEGDADGGMERRVDSPILDEMLEEATEIPHTQGETVLEFIKKQRPVDLESIFKNAERKAWAERDEREAKEARENSLENPAEPENEDGFTDNAPETAFEDAPAGNEKSENLDSETEQDDESIEEESERVKDSAEVIEDIMAKIEDDGKSGDNMEDTDSSDEENNVDLDDDFWSSSADLEPFDKEAAVEKLKRENENKFSKIFDAVENDSEVKLTDWRYAEALKNILPDVLQEPGAEPVLAESDGPHEDFKAQIESLLAKKQEARNISVVAESVQESDSAEADRCQSEDRAGESVEKETGGSAGYEDDDGTPVDFGEFSDGQTEESPNSDDGADGIETAGAEADFSETDSEEETPFADSGSADEYEADTKTDGDEDFESSENSASSDEPSDSDAQVEPEPVQPPVSTSDVEIGDIFSSMDSDAAENPVLKEPIQDVVAKIMEKNKTEEPVETVRSEPVLSEFERPEDRAAFGENGISHPEPAVEMEAAEEALKAASDESYEPIIEKPENGAVEEIQQEPEARQFDPTARPVVDSDGNVIVYRNEDGNSANQSEEIEEDDDELKNEIRSYQNALSEDSSFPFASDEDDEDEEDEEDEDFEDGMDELNRTMNRTMNASEDLDEESEDEDEDDDDDGNERTVPLSHSVSPYASSANSMPESQKFRKGPYIVPTDLLDSYPGNEYWIIDDETRQSGNDLVETLKEFKIDTEITGIRKGPTVTMYELLPAPGVKLSKIVNLQDNIALRLAASSVRIVAPIPGKHAVGIEVPNRNRAIVSFKELIEQPLPAFDKMAIPVVLGKDISGEAQLLDLAKTPHLLIAGSTGAGKSVCVNSMLLSILYKRSPEQVKLVLVDPKVVELKLYNDIPHLLTPVITDAKRALQSLQYCLCEMERRYALLDGMGVRNIISYNKKIVEKNIATEKLPYIVVVIDEFADLMATTGKELETTISRLAAMSRAVGIHLVLATQRPSVDVITGLIKANIPSRIAFMVASKMDSRIIIDQLGADKLLGKGDMLYVGVTDPFPSRIQGTLVGDDEVERVVEYVKGFGEPEYIDEEMFVDEDGDEEDQTLFDEGEDPLYDQALQIVVQAGKASASYIQRRLKIGYNRAARLVEEMENRGIVGPQNGSKPREIIHLPS